MKLIEGTIYEKWPLLLFTPYAMIDIGMATMWNAYIDTCFAVMQHSLTPTKPMGDFHPQEGKK